MRSLKTLGQAVSLLGAICLFTGCANGGGANATAQGATATGGTATVNVTAPVSLSLGDAVAKEAASTAQAWLGAHPGDTAGAVQQGVQAGVNKAAQNGHAPTPAETQELQTKLTKSVESAQNK